MIEVQSGTLTIAQAAGESTAFRLQAPLRVTNDPPATWYVLPSYAPGKLGAPPTPGPGCEYVRYSPRDIRCSAVGRIDIAFGAGTDLLFMQSGVDADLKVPIRISGGDGADSLYVVAPPGDITIDGGSGNDTITTGSARVLGGPGDDAIYLSSVYDDRRSPIIECGPGNDWFMENSILPASMRPIVDAATCPPILRALGRFRRATNDVFPTSPSFSVPKNRKVQLALFRAAEPVSGTVRFRTRGGKPCGKAAQFRTAAGKQARVTLAVLPSLRRRLNTVRGKQIGCDVVVTGTDDEGEPISVTTQYASLLLTR